MPLSRNFKVFSNFFVGFSEDNILDQFVAIGHFKIVENDSILKLGDLVINIASIPLEELGSANMLKLSYID